MKWIPEDKLRHFFVGVEMATLFQFVVILMPTHAFIGTAMNLLVVTIIGYGFELYSKFSGNGHYEIMDAIAVTLGGIVAIASIILLSNLLG